MEVYWRNHRVGKFLREESMTILCSSRFTNILFGTIPRLDITPDATIKEVASLPNLIYDKDFAEVYGITGVEIEP